MVENLKKHAIRMPRCAAADKFTISCTQRVEDGIVELLVVCYKVEFISVNHVKGWSADCFGVVWESFNATAVCEMDLGSLRFGS